MARKRFNFWLDDQRSDDWAINDLITNLKKENQFTRAIRDGLRLWVDLRAGNVEVLRELFPSVVEKIAQGRVTNSTGGAGQLEEIKTMLEIALAEKGENQKYIMKSNPPALPEPKRNEQDTQVYTPTLDATLEYVPVAVAQAAKAASADEIANNFLSAFF